MNDDRKPGSDGDERVLEALFRHATPRPRPRPEARAAAFERLHAEWRHLVVQRRRRRLAPFGAAATLLAAILAGQLWFAAGEPPPQPGRIAVLRASGHNVQVNGRARDPAELASRQTQLQPGDRLTTGSDARLALSWGSGSLRLDRGTRVRLLDGGAVRLAAGSLYFDSTPFGTDPAATAALAVDTPLGRISHAGTQFLTTVDGERVTVSVREGSVRVRGKSVDVMVDDGETIWLDDLGRFERRRIPAHDESWRWAGEIAPELDLEGRTTGEVLSWIARETGRRVRYRSPEARRLADSETRGLAPLAPMPALRTIPVMTSLEYTIDGSYILVEAADNGSNP